MTARTHDAFAFATLLTIVTYHPPDSLSLFTLFGSAIGCVVGSLIPDIDQAGNRLWDLLPVGNQVGKVARRIFYKHRTITHSVLGLYLTYRILEWFLPKILNSLYVDPQMVFWSIMIGYFTHLVADSFTEEGLPLFFPFKLKFGIPPITSWRIKTDGWFEKYVVFPSIGIYLIWFIGNNKDRILHLLKLVTG